MFRHAQGPRHRSDVLSAREGVQPAIGLNAPWTGRLRQASYRARGGLTSRTKRSAEAQRLQVRLSDIGEFRPYLSGVCSPHLPSHCGCRGPDRRLGLGLTAAQIGQQLTDRPQLARLTGSRLARRGTGGSGARLGCRLDRLALRGLGRRLALDCCRRLNARSFDRRGFQRLFFLFEDELEQIRQVANLQRARVKTQLSEQLRAVRHRGRQVPGLTAKRSGHRRQAGQMGHQSVRRQRQPGLHLTRSHAVPRLRQPTLVDAAVQRQDILLIRCRKLRRHVFPRCGKPAVGLARICSGLVSFRPRGGTCCSRSRHGRTYAALYVNLS